MNVDEVAAHPVRARGFVARVLDKIEAWTSHGTAPAHRFAFWLAVVAFIGGVSNAIATSAVFMTGGSPIMTPRVGPFLHWCFGLVPDSTSTFAAGLIAMGVGVGFMLSVFRFVAFRDREMRRLDFILALLQFQPLLWFTLRACMLMPLSAGMLASVRETFAAAISFGFYISCAQPHSRGVLYVSLFALLIYLIGIIDRAIEVGVFGHFQFGVYLQPVIGPDSTGRYFAYLLITELCRCVTIWLCAEQLGSDKKSRRLFFMVALMVPLIALSLQFLRVGLYSTETAPGNSVFVTDIYTTFSIVFGYSISTHWLIYVRMHCKDSLSTLERRVRELNSQAAVSDAVANAQKEFTRYIFHEVRGPLNNIGLGVELLSGFPAVQEHAEMKEIVSLMGESTNIVRRITDDILFIAKVESDQFNLIFSPLSASDLLLSIVHQHSAPASVKGVTLSTTVEPDIPPLLLGDGNRIRQIITNFASNAVKFVPERSGRVRLAVFALSSRAGQVDYHRRSRRAVYRVSSAGSTERPIPGTINRRNFATGLAAGTFGQSSISRTASAGAGQPVNSDARSETVESTAAHWATATWPWSAIAAQLSRCIGALRSARSPSPSAQSAAAGDQLATDPEAALQLHVSVDDGGAADPRLPFSSNPRGAPCPHVVDLPEGVIATPSVIMLRFEVQDNGRGLSVEQRSQLFRPYAQISTSHNHGGTGLGLYISMRLAKQMGGRVGVDSEGEGRGSTFWCELPLRVLRQTTPASPVPDACANPLVSSEGTGLDTTPAPALRPPVPSLFPVQVPAAPITAPLHVLIVDDVDSIRMLMRRLLKQHAPAAFVHEAADGLVACDMMAAAKLAGAPLFSRGVICMDKEMPRCDGYTATQRIRGMGFPGRILGITGNAIAEDVAAFLACGADVVLTKPLSFPVFLGHLRSFAGDTDAGAP